MTKSTKRINKSAWIRSQPASMSAAEVHAKAKKEGITLSIAQVYTARSTAKNKGITGKVGRPRKEASELTDLQRQFAALAVRIGTEDAMRILDGLAHGAVAAAPRLAEARMLAKTVVNGVTSNVVGLS